MKERLISGSGYWMLPKPDNYLGKTYIGGRYVYEHRVVVESSLGRLLLDSEIVHHRNGNKLDNSIDNLEVTTKAAHTSSHSKAAEEIELTCDHCGKLFYRSLRNYKYKRKLGQTKFFCTLSCSVTEQQRQKKASIPR